MKAEANGILQREPISRVIRQSDERVSTTRSVRHNGRTWCDKFCNNVLISISTIVNLVSCPFLCIQMWAHSKHSCSDDYLLECGEFVVKEFLDRNRDKVDKVNEVYELGT